jgi:adenosylhomocysteine nucleosidase
MRIGIVAALPGELKPLVCGWASKRAKDGTRIWTHNANGDVWGAACSGMGADAARRAFAAAEADGPLDMVLSIGWAGAILPELRPGEVCVPSEAIDAQTGERLRLTDGGREVALVTLAHVADKREKLRLRNTYPSAAVVDMEAAVVVRLASMRGIPVACVKAVTDGVSARLPDFSRFIDARGQLRLGALLCYSALRPVYWPALAHLGRDSNRASRAIADLVLKFMEEKNVDRLNRTGYP